ncbi:MAG: nucleoside recognition domain-containing protein [Christensenellaceae bacterium]
MIKMLTVVLACMLAVWVLSSFDAHMNFVSVDRSMLSSIGGWLGFLFAPIGISDPKAVCAALTGLIAKENVAGLLRLFYPAGLPFSNGSAVAYAVFVLTTSPCVMAISSSVSMLGWKKATRNMALQIGTSFLAAYLVYAVWSRPYLLLILLAGIPVEILRRKRKYNPSRLHG